MRNIFMVFLVILSSGCTSYSFRGSQPTIGRVDFKTKFTVKKYSYSCSGRGGATAWSIAQFAGKPVDKTAIERTLVTKYPSLFSQDGGMPIDVEVSLTDGHTGWGGFVLYMLTLGGYPAKTYSSKDVCDVNVSLSNADNVKYMTSEVKFNSSGWLTLWTPFGLIMSDKPGSYTGPYRSGGGIMVAPHLDSDCLLDQQDVFMETVAAGIVSCLGELDETKIPASALLEKKEN